MSNVPTQEVVIEAYTPNTAVYRPDWDICVRDEMHLHFPISNVAIVQAGELGGKILSALNTTLSPYDGKIEINTIALKSGGATNRRLIDAGVVTAFHGQPQAAKVGDLLFISGLMAIDRDGLVAAAAADPRQPHFSSPAEAQAETIIGNIEKLCEAGGSSLANVVRVLMFFTDIGDFYPVYKVWERRLGGRPVPFSAVEVPGPLPVPGATLQIEAWAYAP